MDTSSFPVPGGMAKEARGIHPHQLFCPAEYTIQPEYFKGLSFQGLADF